MTFTSSTSFVGRYTLIVLYLAVTVLGGCTDTEEAPSESRPNIVMILADDMGYSDIGSFGAVHIDTPNLDRMAEEGMRFAQFYNMAKCEPTRTSILSGLFTEKRNAHNAQSLAQLLRDSGYYTAIAGKEHFSGWYPEDNHAKHTFDDSFVYWAINDYFIPEDGSFDHPFELNGEPQDPAELDTGGEPFYKTDVVTNYALRFLDNADQSEAPFFLYLPYHVPHYPLQAPAEDISRYEGAFADGWDQLRRDRFARQKELGVVPSHAVLSEPESNVDPHQGSDEWARYDPWSSIPEAERNNYAREMAVYAAMIDRLDQNVGRVMERLEAIGRADDTLVIFVSDNGACPFDNGGSTGHGDPSFGAPGSYGYQRPEWAGAANTPFRYFKQYGHEGGSHAPFFAYWPGEIESGINTQDVGHVVDLFPTLLDVAGISYPSDVDGRPTPALDGTSLVPVFRSEILPDERMVVSGFGSAKRMVRIGTSKIVRINDGPWELYDLTDDPTETNDLAARQPEKVREIEQRFEAWMAEHEATF